MGSPVMLASLLCVVVGTRPLPDNLINKVVLPENLIKHHLDVVAGVPVAVIVEAARIHKHTREFHAPRAHELDVGMCGFVPIFE